MAAASTRPGRPPGKQGAELLAVAREAFLEMGFDRTTMGDIAQRAGVSKSSLYREHSSKDDLFTAVVTDWAEQGRGAMAPHLEALLAEPDIAQALTEFSTVLLAAVTAPPVVGMRRLIAAEADRFPDVAELYLRLSWQTNLHALANALAQLDQQGRLTVDDPATAAEQLVWMSVGAPLNAYTLGAAGAADQDRDVGIHHTVETFLARYATAGTPARS